MLKDMLLMMMMEREGEGEDRVEGEWEIAIK